MVDVKLALSNALTIWLVALVVLVLLGLWARFGGWWATFRWGLGRGGLLSMFLILLVIVIVLLSFGIFFVAFHNVFFEPGTWMFLWSDTLIRLFPERFWRDIFIYVGLITAGLGLLIAYLCGSFPIRFRSRS
jgi:integral membrane protein (TIGR01906 family)